VGLSTENKKFKTSVSQVKILKILHAMFINHITVCSHFIKPASVISVPFVVLHKTRHDKSDDCQSTDNNVFPAGNWPV
jgi:hypothetical protein